MLLFSLSHYLSLFLSACLSSVDTLDIDFTHGQKYEQNKTHVCKTRSRMRAFHFQCNDNSVARGRHLRVPPQQQQQLQLEQPFPFAVLLAICLLLKNDLSLCYILSSLTQTHTDRHTDTLEKSHKFFRGQSPPNTRVSSFLFGLASIV